MGCSREAEVLALLEAIYERVCADTGSEDSRPCMEYKLVLNDLRAHGIETTRRRYGI